jgi:hypothetical protein
MRPAGESLPPRGIGFLEQAIRTITVSVLCTVIPALMPSSKVRKGNMMSFDIGVVLEEAWREEEDDRLFHKPGQ